MPELTIAEMLAWPALAAAFARHFRGGRAGLIAWAAAQAGFLALIWGASAAGSRNRALLAEAGQVLLWAGLIAVPVGLYAFVLIRARRAARRHDR